MTKRTKALPHQTKLFRSLILAVGLITGTLPSIAPAAWPADQPINMIIAYAPGGGTDIIARSIIPFIEKHLGDGARITVLNRPGAGGGIGFGAIAAGNNDGYTIGFVNTPPVVTIPIERRAVELAKLRPARQHR